MEDLSFLMKFVTDFRVTIFCFIIGFIIKKWVKDVDNKLIPTVVFFMGMILSVVFSVWEGNLITPDTLLSGALSGVLSSGSYELFRPLLEFLKILRNPPLDEGPYDGE